MTDAGVNAAVGSEAEPVRPAADATGSRDQPHGDTRNGALARRRYALGMAAIAAVGFGLRLLTLFTVAHRNPTGGDPLYYHLQANFLVHGHGFADPFIWQLDHRYVAAAVHPPLYSLWLAVTGVFGATGFFAHKVMSCLAGTLTIVLIGLVGREIAGRRAGLIAAALAAVYPPLWVIDGILMPEGLFTATIALSILCAYRWRRSPGWRWAAALGVAIGLAALTRGEASVLVVLLGLPVIAARKGVVRREKLQSAGVLVVAFVAVLAPWMIRNLLTFKDFVPLSTNGNEVLVYANNPFAYGTADHTYVCRDPAHHPSAVELPPTGDSFMGFWFYPWQDYLRCVYGEPTGDASQKAKYWQNKGVEYARQHPGRVATVAAVRVGRIWDVYAPFQNAFFSQIEGRKKWVSDLGLWCYWALLPVAVAGLVVLRRRRVSIFPLVVQAALVTIVAIYAYGIERFRTPVDVALLVAAAVAIDAAIRHWRKRPVPLSPQELDAPIGEEVPARSGGG